MVRDFIQHLKQRVQRLITEPISEMRRGRRAIRYSIDLSVMAARAMRQRGVTMTASALSYRTIFAIIPTAILVLIIFRAFLAYETAEGIVRDNAYRVLNIDAITQGMSGDEAFALRATIDERITAFLQHAYHLDTGQLGVAGGVLLVWAVVTLIMTVEQSFNRIFEAPTGRPWHQRVVMYWMVITAGPLLLVLSLYLARRIGSELTALPGLGWLLALLGGLSGLAATWLLLLLLYRIVPTVKVKLKAALIGSLVAAIMWQFGQWGFGVYASGAVGYSKVYGTLSLLPLGLIWVQLSWLVVLFGLHLTYAIQHMRNYQQRQRRTAENDLGAIADPLWVSRLMATLGERFQAGNPCEREDLADVLELPVALVAQITDRLEQAGLIHRIQEGGDETGGYMLSMPPEKIALDRLLTIGEDRDPCDTSSPADPLMRLREAQRDAARGRTLADVLAAR